MDIKFDKINDTLIHIMNNGKVIGRIFTPAGTEKDISNAIQICGFDEAFDLWACGVFGDGGGHPKKDLSLLFNENSVYESSLKSFDMSSDCGRCFYPKDKCKCSELILRDRKELVLKKLVDYDPDEVR